MPAPLARFLPIAGLLTAACLAAAPSPARATPLAASMAVEAYAQVGVLLVDVRTDSASWGVPLTSLSVSATASTAASPPSATAFISGSATWGAGGNSGTITFPAAGWAVTGITGTSVTVSAGNNGDPVYTYRFIADGNGTLHINYAITGSGTGENGMFGLNGWSAELKDIVNDTSEFFSVGNVNDPGGSGSTDFALVAGQTYELRLRANPNVAGNVIETSATMVSNFDFTITDVPEPATLALLGAGLLGLTAARRRR